ncbi:MFS transporter [Kitasatospora herbaricolor]|uniref:MFS transporter n=1 Tax=Kitasatospora herbaricolor TaxID=68217 RepID=A0ABZ1W6M0_9ACTN|nr:MFS transporter [Kitasatospora herbaricolor]
MTSFDDKEHAVRPGTLSAPVLADPRTVRGRALVPVLVFLGMVVAVVSSLGAPLVPTVAADYGVSLGGAQWSLTITLLAGAVATPVLSRLSDGPHRRRVVLGALALIVTGCVLAALPAGFPLLLAGRALQGIGLGLTPLAMGVARDHLPGPQARSAVATLSVTTVAGVGLGYPLTGMIAQHLGFHAAFWVAAAAGAAVLAAAAFVLPASTHRPHRPLDAPGAVLLGLGLAALLVALSEGGQWGWTSARLLAVAAVAPLALGAWVRHELRTQHPLVALRLLRNRAVLAADVTGLVAGVGMYFLMSLVIRYVQTPVSAGYGLGRSVVVAALTLLPFSVASVGASRVAPLIGRRFGARAVMPAGALAFVVAMLVFCFARSGLWEIFLLMGIAGLGVGCTFAAMPAFIVSAVPPGETGSALGVNQVLRVIGGSIGSALSAGILTAHTTPPARLPAESGYTVATLVGIGVWVFAGLAGLLLPARRPAGTGAAGESAADGAGSAGRDGGGDRTTRPAAAVTTTARNGADGAGAAAGKVAAGATGSGPDGDEGHGQDGSRPGRVPADHREGR